MKTIKRYWAALDDASHKAIKKAAFLGPLLGLALLAVYLILFYKELFQGTLGDDAALKLVLLPLLIIAAAALSLYSCVLIFRAHKAIKKNLFAHPENAPRTSNTWTHADGLILALALIGITSIPASILGFAMNIVFKSTVFYEPNSAVSLLAWPIIGLALAPVAAKRSIPLPPDNI